MSYGEKAAQRLAGKTALITGASSGIGEAIASELAEAANGDIKLILTARRFERLKKLEENLKSKHEKVRICAVEFDVSKIGEIKSFINSIPEEFADIDILINNAGKALGREQVGSIPDEDIKEMFDTNVLSLIMLTQEVLPIFKVRNSGDVVNMGSTAGSDPYPGGGIYCPTKAAVKSFSHALRKELINTSVRVIEIDPGKVETEFSLVRYKGDVERAQSEYRGAEPLTAVDIAEVVVFALTRKQNTVIAESLVLPTSQASASYVYRANK